jgi:hypothetical protein
VAQPRNLSRLDALEVRESVYAPVEADDAGQAEALCQDGVVGIHEGNIEVGIQIEHLAESPFARQYDPAEFEQAEDLVSDLILGHAVLALKGEYRFEHHCVRDPYAGLAALDLCEQGR